MINTHLRERALFGDRRPNDILNDFIQSRNLFGVQTIDYALTTVTSLDIDECKNFMLVGLSNGAVDLQEIEDPTFGTLGTVSRFQFSRYNMNRVQWSPGGFEQFFSMVDNHNLYLVDPVEVRILDKYEFNMKINWSEWNANDRKMIAVCGSESQVRLVDVKSGSAAQTLTLSAPSRLATHRATRCLWSKLDLNCILVGDNEGYIHVYDTRKSSRPYIVAGEERGQISGMAFTTDNCSVMTSQGTDNHIVQWTFDKCTLQPHPHKFKKRKEVPPEMIQNVINEVRPKVSNSAKVTNNPSNSKTSLNLQRTNNLSSRPKKRTAPLAVDAYLRCQFHVTDRHLFCPVPSSTRKSQEIHIHDLKNGDRVKTLESNDILSRDVSAVTSLLPESLVLYVGGRERLRVWSTDEGYQQRMDEKIRRYHQSTWDSDDEI